MSDAMAKALHLQQLIEKYADEQACVANLLERIEEIKVARLLPGDVLLVKLRRETGVEEIKYMQRVLEAGFPDNKYIILDGVDIEIVRPEPDTCAYGHIRTWSSAVCQVCGELQEDPPPATLVADPDMLTDIERA